MFLTLTQIGQLYDISAIKTGNILYELGVRDPEHPEVKGFPYEQYIIHNIAHANLGNDGKVKYFTYDITTLKEEFEALVNKPKEKPSFDEVLINKITALHEEIDEVKNLEIQDKLHNYLSDISYLIEQNNITRAMPLNEKALSLYERLKTYRKHKATSQNISAFLIFTNAMLHELSFSQPKDLDELLIIKGFGEKKIKSYGEEIINIIKII